jgi:hypothetical protein
MKIVRSKKASTVVMTADADLFLRTCTDARVKRSV